MKILVALRTEGAGWRVRLAGEGVWGSDVRCGYGIRRNCVGICLCIGLGSQAVAVLLSVGSFVMVLVYVLLEAVWEFA